MLVLLLLLLLIVLFGGLGVFVAKAFLWALLAVLIISVIVGVARGGRLGRGV